MIVQIYIRCPECGNDSETKFTEIDPLDYTEDKIVVAYVCKNCYARISIIKTFN